MDLNGKVYVVDDDAMVRRSTVMMLASAGYQARPFGGGQDFIDEMPWLGAGCVMLDIRMPEVDGFGVLSAMADKFARFPVIVMTGHGDIATAVQAMKLGAADFLEKPFEETVVFDILVRLKEGGATVEQELCAREQARAKVASLTPRERDVLRALTAGLPNKLVADRMSLSIRTVEMHRANLMDKLGVRTLADALRIGFQAESSLPH